MVLILSDKFDQHADLVQERLIELGGKFYRMDLDVESLKQTFLDYESGSWMITTQQGAVNSSQISHVWVRRSFVEPSLQEEENQDVHFRIWRNEWNKTLLGLYLNLNSANWLNPLSRSFQAENKYYQMKLAQESSFKLPPMIVSNIKSQLMKFADTHKEVVIKLMSQDFYKANDGSEYKGIYVNKISAHDLEGFNSLGENPIVLQKYIAKSYEVRYTVVGDDHHVCMIESQRSKISNIDWRRYDLPNTPHYRIEPPKDVANKIKELMSRLGICFGAFDFIVTPEDDWYFLEVNPNGQWLWIENLTNLPISMSIARWLTL